FFAPVLAVVFLGGIEALWQRRKASASRAHASPSLSATRCRVCAGRSSKVVEPATFLPWPPILGPPQFLKAPSPAPADGSARRSSRLSPSAASRRSPRGGS